MKKILFLFIMVGCNLFATNYYVDKNATGTGAGTSWTNAWESFADIPWGSINPGDIIYVSGGADSTVYYENILVDVSGTAGNYVTIRNSYEAGHNGKVIVDGEMSRLYGIRLGTSSGTARSYVYIKGFNFRRHASNDTYGAVFLHYQSSYNVIDSCIFVETYGRGITIRGNNSTVPGAAASNNTIKYCYIETVLDAPYQSDGIFIQHAANTTLDHNFIWARNLSLVNNHSDAVQGTYNRGFRITNNIIVCDSNAQGMAMILGAGSATATSDSVILYNNILINRGIWWAGNPPDVATFNTRWYSGVPGATQFSPTIAINNTILSYGPDAEGIRIYYPFHVFKNNIVAQYGSGSNPGGDGYKATMTVMGGANQTINTTIFGVNLFDRQWSADVSFSGTWTPDINNFANYFSVIGEGYNTDPIFAHNWYGIPANEYTGELDVSSPAIGVGEDLQSVVEGMGLVWEDRLGTPRGSAPSLGAYEYVTGTADTTATVLFTPVRDANLNSYHIASGVLSGADSTFHVWAYAPGPSPADSFKINYDGILDIVMVEAEAGDTLYIAGVASSQYNTEALSYVNVSGIVRSFSITTKAAPDTIPVIPNFTSVVDADTSTLYISNTVTLTDFDSCYASAGGQEFRIDTGLEFDWGTALTKVYKGDNITLRRISSNSFSTPLITTFTAGGQSKTWTITTKASSDSIPNAFTFTDFINAAPSYTYTSNPITILGFDSCWASAGGNEFRVNGGNWLTALTKIYSGDEIELRKTSSNNHSTKVEVPFSAGGISDVWSITTRSGTGTKLFKVQTQ